MEKADQIGTKGTSEHRGDRFRPGNHVCIISYPLARILSPPTWQRLTYCCWQRLARRSGQPGTTRVKKVNSDEWLQALDIKIAERSSKGIASGEGDEGNRDLMRLPFSRNTLLDIAGRFCMHKSIVRTISRTNISSLSHNDLQMNSGKGASYPAHGKYSKCLPEEVIMVYRWWIGASNTK